MRIAIFTDTYTPDVNGVVTSIVTLQKELEKHGHTVFVVTSSSSLIHFQREGNVLRLPAVEVKKLYGYHLSGPFSITGLADVKAMNLDLIHVQTEFGIGTFARICSHMLNIPMVYTYHTMYEDYTNYLMPIESKPITSALRTLIGGWSAVYSDLCNELIAPSEKTRDKLIEYGITDKEIAVIPTGLDLERFYKKNFSDDERKALRVKLGVKDNEYMLLFVGRLAEEKSVDVILDAMVIAKAQNLPIHCVIVGAGPALNDLKDMSVAKGISDVVNFTGKIMPADVPIYYSATDMFCSASLSETQGLTFVEAMGSDTAVFARDRNVLADLIEDGYSGFFFDSPEHLVERMKEFMNMSQEEKAAICQHALEKAVPFDAEHFYQEVIKVYEKAVTEVRDVFVIESVKLKHDNYFEVKMANAAEEYALLLKLDTYYKDHLQKDMGVSRERMESYQKEDMYNRALLKSYNYLAFKDRTRKEMYDYITQHFELPIKEVNEMIESFERDGYINDERYVATQIEGMRAALLGRRRIQNELVKKGIPHEMVDDELDSIHDSYFLDGAKSVIENTLPTMKSKNSAKTRLAIEQKLQRMGYNYNIITEAMSSFDFDKSAEEEEALLLKEYSKQYERLCRKYEGKELRNKLITTLIRKGYDYDQVRELVEENLNGIQVD